MGEENEKNERITVDKLDNGHRLIHLLHLFSGREKNRSPGGYVGVSGPAV